MKIKLATLSGRFKTQLLILYVSIFRCFHKTHVFFLENCINNNYDHTGL